MPSYLVNQRQIVWFCLIFCNLFLISDVACDSPTPTIQLNVAGTQSALYVHRGLLSDYASNRTENINIKSFTNLVLYSAVIANGTFMTWVTYLYTRFSARESIVDHMFSNDENQFPLFLAFDNMFVPSAGKPGDNIAVVPAYFYEMIVIYNLPSGTGNPQPALSLTQDLLFKIFTGAITMWDDDLLKPALNISNPAETNLVGKPITVYLIGPPSPLTVILSVVLMSWGAPSCILPSNPGVPANKLMSANEFGQCYGSLTYTEVDSADAAIGAVLNNQYTIAYTSLINYKQINKVTGVAALQNHDKNFVAPSMASLYATTTGRVTFNVPDSMHPAPFPFLDNPGANSYPLVAVSYLMMLAFAPNHTDLNCTIAAELLRYYRWINRDSQAKTRLASFGTIAVSEIEYNYYLNNLSKHLKCKDATYGEAMTWDIMLLILAAEAPIDYVKYIFEFLLAPLLLISFVVYTNWRILKHMRLNRKVNRGQYHIRSRDIIFIEASKERYRDMLKMRRYLDSRYDVNFVTGEFGFCVVLLRPLNMAFNSANVRVRQELIHMQEWKTHKNLLRFMGVTEMHKDRYIVSELSLLGDLRTLLSDHATRLTTPVSFCMARGITDGLRYLHQLDIVHGNLRSTSIYVESDWTVKISDWEYVHLYNMQGTFVSKEHIFRKLQRACKELQAIFLTPLLWTAPELLKAALEQKRMHPTKEADSYSYGIIFYEILTRNTPYKYDMDNPAGPMATLLKVLNPKKPIRPLDLETPEALSEIPESMLRLMRACWQVNPKDRVTTKGMSIILDQVQAETKRMADLTIVDTDFFIDKQKSDIKNYNADLKQRVLDLRRASEDFLTPPVYERTKLKLPVIPEVAQQAYIMHVSMVEYAELLDPTHGESAIALIERFQALVNQHLANVNDVNIFRIHTGGDDCTIIAGILKGGLEYADAIAVMAFDVLAITWKAVMLDIDTDHIKIRIGIHCGPVLAGLYGDDHTEYTVIGETRDIAEDMERLSGTYRILISGTFLNEIKKFDGYTYIENTDSSRYHEKVKTYWLLGRDNYTEQNSLDEIYSEYGMIEDGRIPPLVKGKKLKSAVAGAAMPLTERAQHRRSSIASHLAMRVETKERPSILERRNSVNQGQRRQSRGSVFSKDAMNNLSTSLAQAGIDEAATFDVVRLRNNQETLVADFSGENENVKPQASLMPTVSVEGSQLSTEVFTNADQSRTTIGSQDGANSIVPMTPAIAAFVQNPKQYYQAARTDALKAVVIMRDDDSGTEQSADDQRVKSSEPAGSGLPHSHELNRLRRKTKRKSHRPSFHSSAGTDNPVDHLDAPSNLTMTSAVSENASQNLMGLPGATQKTSGAKPSLSTPRLPDQVDLLAPTNLGVQQQLPASTDIVARVHNVSERLPQNDGTRRILKTSELKQLPPRTASKDKDV